MKVKKKGNLKTQDSHNYLMLRELGVYRMEVQNLNQRDCLLLRLSSFESLLQRKKIIICQYLIYKLLAYIVDVAVF